MFKFRDLLCEKDRKLFDDFYQQLEGKTIYIPKDKQQMDDFYLRRNRKITQRFSELRKTGKSVTSCIMFISESLPEARGLSYDRIRTIIYSTKKKMVFKE